MPDLFVSAPGEGILVGGRGPLVKAFGEHSGSWSFVEGALPPRTDGPPLHVHRSHGEAFYVVAGTLTLLLEDGEREVPAGAYAYCPPGLVHGFANRSDELVRFVGMTDPGVERMLIEMAEAGSPQEALEVAARYDSELR